MLQRIYEKKLTTGTVASATYTEAIDMNLISTVSVQAVCTVNTPGAKTFAQDNVSTTNDTFPITAHGYPTGLKVRATSTGTLPAGITTGTDYFIIVVSANLVSVASSLVNALAGTKIDITDTGTAAATGTFTPTSIAGGTLSFQYTNIDCSTNIVSTTAADWFDIQTATAITATATVTYGLVGPLYRWFRIKTDLTAGSVSNVYYVEARGEQTK